MPEIATFVFFDIETTGLPWQERNQTKITELSFVAALRKDLEITPWGGTPIVSKLTFVINPQRPIHQEVVKLTGLTNESLRHAPTFRQKLRSIISFLEDLPKPVCLVAHNGNAFDFKILLAEINDVSASLPADLLCVDSLPGFRNILKGTNINFHNMQTQIPLSLRSRQSSDISDLLTEDEDDEWPDLNVSNEEWQEIDDICLSMSDMSCEDFSEPEKLEMKKNIRRKRSEVIKKVFEKKTDCFSDKESFKLTDLYKRLLNKEQKDAHRAEVDCFMLIHCVVAMKDTFLQWADSNCKLLTDITPLCRTYTGRSYKNRPKYIRVRKS